VISIALKYSPRRYLKPALWLAALSAITYVAAVQCKVDLPALFHSGSGVEKVLRFLEPQWSLLPEMLAPAGVTVLIAFLATPLAAMMSLLLGAAAASNLSPRWLRQTTRVGLGFERALPEMIILLVLVAGARGGLRLGRISGGGRARGR
jgi:phosphonate transport system permease protein